jgi:hypothetical protein
VYLPGCRAPPRSGTRRAACVEPLDVAVLHRPSSPDGIRCTRSGRPSGLAPSRHFRALSAAAVTLDHRPYLATVLQRCATRYTGYFSFALIANPCAGAVAALAPCASRFALGNGPPRATDRWA